VTRRYVEVGQWVEVGEPIADVVQLDPLHVRVNVPESVISRVKPGDPAKVTFDALGREPLTGKIDQIIPSADPSSRTYPVRILLPNPEHRVWPGFFGRAVLTSQSQDPAFLVPRDAVMSGGQVPHRIVVAREGKAVVVPVSLGAGAGDKVAVTGELAESDQVIVRGNEALRGGEQLMILNAPPPGAAPSGTPPATQQAPQAQTAQK
jgi:RND family efflux transporter MFP subunit